MMDVIKFKRLHPDAKLPTYGSAGAAGFDFYAVTDGQITYPDVQKVGLGLACEVPEGFALLILARSGHGLKHNVGIPHGVGLIDSDYRGELAMVFTPDDCAHPLLKWKAGDRIAQGLIVPAPQYAMEWADELSPTERGVGGFGSSGK